MDCYRKKTSSTSCNLKDPPTLSQLSDVLFDSNQVNMNNSTSKTAMISCDIEQSDENETTHTTAEDNTNVKFL